MAGQIQRVAKSYRNRNMALEASTASQDLVIGIHDVTGAEETVLCRQLVAWMRTLICCTESAVLEQYVRRLKEGNSLLLHCERVNNGSSVRRCSLLLSCIRLGATPSTASNLIASRSGSRPGGDAAGPRAPSVRGSLRPQRPVAGARRGIRLRGRSGGGRRGRRLNLPRGTDEQPDQDGDREHEGALHAPRSSHTTCHATAASCRTGTRPPPLERSAPRRAFGRSTPRTRKLDISAPRLRRSAMRTASATAEARGERAAHAARSPRRPDLATWTPGRPGGWTGSRSGPTR